MPLIAGVDSSTQSTKVEIRDQETGAVVASASAPHPAVMAPLSEQDPASWWTAFEHAWAQGGGGMSGGLDGGEVGVGWGGGGRWGRGRGVVVGWGEPFEGNELGT